MPATSNKVDTPGIGSQFSSHIICIGNKNNRGDTFHFMPGGAIFVPENDEGKRISGDFELFYTDGEFPYSANTVMFVLVQL